MWLWVDDVRPPPEGLWLVATSYDGAIRVLETGVVTVLSLDHDLGEGKSGYDIVNWVERKIACGEWRSVPVMTVHSANPVGRANIERAIRAIKAREITSA